MQIGMVGLGRMGANMARRLLRGGHACVVYDRDQSKTPALAAEGARAAGSLAALVEALRPPRAVWLMLPAGEITQQAVEKLAPLLARGDLLIDGGNSHYTDDLARAALVAPRGIEYVDCGTSGGVWGLERGYCLMIGASPGACSYLEPVFRTLAPGPGDIPKTPGREGRDASAEQGYLHCGPVGSGHYVKMVHNGIEYGIMQAYAEGFALLRKADFQDAGGAAQPLPLPDVAEVWRRGSVISSWLLDLTAMALARSPDLHEFEGIVADSGEGRWTVEEAIRLAVPCEVLTAALYMRFRSRLDHTFADKLLSAMRAGFGGHVEPAGP